MTDDIGAEQAEVLTGPTAQLTFLGPSHDGSRILLASQDGQRFELAVDARLVAVVSREHRERTTVAPKVRSEGLTPREIQDRVRHGATVEDLADEQDLDADEIARFAHPVITERAHVAEQAKAASVVIDGDVHPLATAVSRRLRNRGVDTTSTLWDAWRRQGSEWTVVVAYPVTNGTQVATFHFDNADRTVSAADDEARWLLEIGPEPAKPNNSAAAQQPKTSEADSRWDKAHPAARAAQRRESSATPVEQAPERSPAEPRGDQQTKDTSHWEELLFGSTKDD